jgi:hypothetical protein
MSASMKIDQVGLPAGVDGYARTDGLSDNSLVTLTSITVGTTYKFEFLWVPPDDDEAVSSLAASGSPEIWTFSPKAGVYGSYRIHLIVDEGLETEEETTRIFGIRNSSGLLTPAFNEKADEDSTLLLNGATQIEASENNEESDNSGYRWAGWWDHLDLQNQITDELNRTRYIQQSFNEQADTSPTSIGMWYIEKGTLVSGASVYIGSNTGTHQVTARLRRESDPVPIVAQWQVTGGLQNVATASDTDIPASDWYYLEIFSSSSAAVVLLDGANFKIIQESV